MILSDRWELLERLGEGAMGEVWRGRHVVLGHFVAVKIMKPAGEGESDLVARFVREGRIAARLRCPYIVRVDDFGTLPDGRPYMVMELLDGQPVSARLGSPNEPPNYGLALRVAHDVGVACDVAHAAGIVHRDLKPENCFLVMGEGGNLVVKVLDFGIAKVTDSLLVSSAGVATAAHALIGTPAFMSPEQARGDRDLDGRSDLYSLGVMIYEVLTLRLPYDAPGLTQLLFAVLNGRYVPPSAARAGLPRSFDAWVARALALDRGARFQSGKELSDALVAALESRTGVGLRETLPATQPLTVVARESVPARTEALPAYALPSQIQHPPTGVPGTEFRAPTVTRTSNRRAAMLIAAGVLVAAVATYGLRAWMHREPPQFDTPSRASAALAPPVPSPMLAPRPALPLLPPIARTTLPGPAAVERVPSSSPAPAVRATEDLHPRRRSRAFDAGHGRDHEGFQNGLPTQM